jgi:hypothetical protein
MGLGWCFVGVDLGQAKDFTAVAILERAELVRGWDPVTYACRKHVELRLRYLERLPLGTPYPRVAERVVKVTRSAEMAGRCSLVVDATGVGRPVVDLLKRERPGCTLMPVNITGGASESKNGGYYGVPKRDLVTGVQVLLQSGGLQIASGIPHGAALAAEMADMRAKVTAAGNTQFGAWREGAHDDLVLAVALACWGARKMYPHGPYGAEAYWKRTEQGDWERGMKEWAQGRVV